MKKCFLMLNNLFENPFVFLRAFRFHLGQMLDGYSKIEVKSLPRQLKSVTER